MDVDSRSSKKDLHVLGIKKYPRVSWEECENKIYELLEKNWRWTQVINV